MRWFAWLLVAACSGRAGGAAHPASPPAAQSAPPPADDAPSEAECDQLITHAVALGINEQGRMEAPRSTESDHEAVRRSLHDDFVAGCRTLPRDAYRCAMAATTLAALAACQRTPSSSTSNSSVAPGGILPPAPRSP
ncbi:MAG TPA: hypothetical protein VF516_19910 [Kofleriaceae bacterium]